MDGGLGRLITQDVADLILSLKRRVEALEARETRRVRPATATWDPPSLAAGETATTTIAVTGAAVGDLVFATHSQLGTSAALLTGHVQTAGTVRVALYNGTGGVLDVASGTLAVEVWER